MKRPRQPKPKLKESEARYRRLLDMFPDAILIYCGGKCVFANAAAARLFGAASPRKMLGLDVLDLTHPDFRKFVQQRINFAYGGKHEQLQEIKILRLDGHPVDIEIMALAITYQGLPAIQVVLKDMTCRKLAEEAVR
jgi:PAS domain S-box-containing protein